MNKIKYLLLIFSLFIFSCESEDYELGDIIPPENLVISADIIGADSENPYGDGSGQVNFTATADRGITYDFIVNGSDYLRPSGEFEMYFSSVGLNTYTVEVRAYGVAGTMITGSVSVDVLVTYEPPAELVSALTTGTWRVKAEESGYLGVGPVDGETDSWYSAPPYTHSATAMFDDNYTFAPINNLTGTGNFSVASNGAIFGKAPPLFADFTGDQGLTPNQFDEIEFYPIDDFTANWFISAPGDVLHINFTGNGFLGFYVGGGLSYEILSWDSNNIHARTVGYDNNMWYIKITNQP